MSSYLYSYENDKVVLCDTDLYDSSANPIEIVVNESFIEGYILGE